MEYPTTGSSVPGTYNEKSKLEAAIEKFGGKDENYKLTLKKQIRDYLGYSNYIARANKVNTNGGKLNLPSGPMTPGGISNAVDTANKNQATEINYLTKMAEVTGDIGDSMASTKLAALKSKASGNAKDLFMDISSFKPQNENESLFQDYIKNPFKATGTFLPLEEWKKNAIARVQEELPGIDAAKYIEQIVDKYMPNDTNLSKNFQTGLTEKLKEEHPSATPDELKSLFDESLQVLPENLQYEWHKYYYKSIGQTDAQAENSVQRDKYANDQMAPGERTVYEQNNPQDIEQIQIMKANPSLQADLSPKVFEDGSEGIAKSFDELRATYPNIDEAKLKAIATPVYEKEAKGDIDIFLQSQPTLLSKVTTTKELAEVISSVDNNPEFNSQIELLAAMYNGVFTVAQMKAMFKTKVLEAGQQNVAKYAKIREQIRQQNPGISPEAVEDQVLKMGT